MRGILQAAVALSVMLATPVVAQEAPLQAMETTEDGREWQAVGRLNLAGQAFCTGALIEADLVLTAAHCLFDRDTGLPIPADKIEFLAGWRNGRAAAYRQVRRAVVHPEYDYRSARDTNRVRNDVALLQLQRPIRNTTVVPFATDVRPSQGDKIGVVSYAHDRSEAPALQDTCEVVARQKGVLVMSCDVDFGSSGAPVFSFAHDDPRIVSVVSAKAEAMGAPVSLGTALEGPLQVLRVELANDRRRVVVGTRNTTGAKFITP